MSEMFHDSMDAARDAGFTCVSAAIKFAADAKAKIERLEAENGRLQELQHDVEGNAMLLAYEKQKLEAEVARLRQWGDEIFANLELFKSENTNLNAEIARLRAALEEIAGWILPTGIGAQEVARRALEGRKG